MGLLSGLTKIALSPVVGVAQVIADVTSDDDDGLTRGAAIASLGTIPMAKGTIKGVVNGVTDILK